jgi:glycosyltransferase involved in cell wall biosynthesis
MNVLLWRGWRPAFNEGLTFTTVHHRGIGGTEMQMLWHAHHLAVAGHHVQVLGATWEDIDERGVDFVGAADRSAQEAAVARGRVREPELILLEGSFQAAAYFKQLFPMALIVHVGQNIDAYAAGPAFSNAKHIDLFAFVSLGHLAEYCSCMPALRHKFVLLRNALPWREFHGRIELKPPENKLVWVGSWTKKGLRTWFRVMETVLRERPFMSWVLCGPAYSSANPSLPKHLGSGLHLPWDRVTCKTLPLMELLDELASARAVLVSLGNETASISALDAHAVGRPAISGNDMVYKFTNPNGTGLRVTTADEAKKAVDFLIDNPAIADALGQAGRRWVQAEYHEERQKDDLAALVDFTRLDPKVRTATANKAPSKGRERLLDLADKISRHWRTLRSPE